MEINHPQFPFWIGLILVLSLAVALWVYRKARRFSDLSLAWRLGVAMLRFLSLFILGLVLLAPQTVTQQTESMPPIVALGVDHSSSMKKDSALLFDQIEKIKQWADANEVDLQLFDVNRNTLFQDEKLQWSEETNIGQWLNDLDARYQGQALRGHFILSDGIFNAGQNPLYLPEITGSLPVALAFGDTNTVPDLSILDVIYNPLVSKGRKTPIEIQMAAKQLKGESFRVLVKDGRQEIYSENIRVNKDNAFIKTRFDYLPERTGLINLEVQLQLSREESNALNNKYDMVLEVVDEQLVMGVFSTMNHPDLGMLKLWADGLDAIECINIDPAWPKNAWPQMDIMVLFQPQSNWPKSWVDGIRENESTSRWLWLGAKSEPRVLNDLDLAWNWQANGTQKIQTSWNVDYPHFSWEKSLEPLLQNGLPLWLSSAKPSSMEGVDVLAHQKIGNLNTPFPLLFSADRSGRRTGVWMAEGWWRKRLYAHRQGGSSEALDRLLEKWTRFLAAAQSKDLISIDFRTKYQKFEVIRPKALVQNKAGEPIPDLSVRLVLNHQEGESLEFFGNYEAGFYSFDINQLAPGTYTYVLEIDPEMKQEVRGQFHVQAVSKESLDRKARWNWMQHWAEKDEGHFVVAKEEKDWLKALETQLDLRPMQWVNYEKQSIIHWKWLAALVFLLLGLEWILRKLKGMI